MPEVLKWMMGSVLGSATIVANGRLDLLAVNDLGRALYSPVYTRVATAVSP